MRKIVKLLVLFAVIVLIGGSAYAQNSGTLAPDPTMGVPSTSDKNPPDNPDNSATTPDAGTPATASGGHIYVKPHLNIESDKNPMTDDDALLQLIASMPEEVQKDLMEEASWARGYCEHNAFLNNYYDCSCFSFRIVAERISKGPGIQSSNLIDTARYSQCVDDAKIAGYGLNNCTYVLNPMSIPTEQMNDICACVGRTMATTYKQNPLPNVGQVQALFTDVLTYCRGKYNF